MTCFGQKLFAQNGFFIRPGISTKANLTSYGIDGPLHNTYFDFKKQGIFWSNKPLSLKIGAFLEKEFNGRVVIGLGVSQDEIGAGFKLNFLRGAIAGNDTVYYIDRPTIGSGRIKSTRISLLFGTTFYRRDSLFMIGNHNFGIAGKIFLTFNLLLQKKAEFGKIVFSFGEDSILNYPGTYLSYSSRLLPSYPRRLLTGIGIDIKFTHKNKEMFTLSASGIYGRKPMSVLYTNISINNEIFTTAVYGNGSGLYLQISKGISLQRKNKTKKS